MDLPLTGPLDLLSARLMSVLHPSLQDPALPPPVEGWCTVAGRWLALAVADGRETVAQLLHLGGNPFMNAAVIATAPLVLLMHATMPALTNSARPATSHVTCTRLRLSSSSCQVPHGLALTRPALTPGYLARRQLRPEI